MNGQTKCGTIHKKEDYYSTIKSNELLMQATWMNLENIRLSTQEIKDYTLHDCFSIKFLENTKLCQKANQWLPGLGGRSRN